MPIFTIPSTELTEFNRCHNPAGRPDGGQFCSDQPGRVQTTLLPQDIESYTDWVTGQPRWKFKDTSILMKGSPIPREELAGKTLYHVTTRLGKVLASGKLKVSQHTGGGLGGGASSKSVSFTTSRADAMNIARTLDGARTVLLADDPGLALRAWAKRDARLAGIDPTPLLAGVDEAMKHYALNQKYSDESSLSARIDAVRSYLWTRDRAGIKNPVLFNVDQLARPSADWDVGIIVMKGKSLPKDPVVNWGADKFQREVEVHGDVPIQQAAYLTSRDLTRYRRRRYRSRPAQEAYGLLREYKVRIR